MPKPFRFKALIPFLVVGILFTCFYLFFLDGIIKRGIISASESANGAKVEIDHFDLQLFNSAVKTGGIRVTDKDHPMKNLFEIGELSFDMDSNYLSRKKVIVETMVLTGLAFGTDRKVSGALKTTKVKKSEKKQAKAAIKESFIGDIDYKSLIANANIPIVKKAASLEKLIKERRDYWEKRLKNVTDLKDVEQAVDTIKSINVNNYKKIEDIPRVKKDIDRVQNAVNVIKAKKDELEKVKADIRKDQALLKKEYKELKALKDKGVKGMVFPGGSTEGLAKELLKMLFGDSLIDKGFYVLNQYEKYKEFIPKPKKSKAEVQPQTRKSVKGITVDFIGADAVPKYLVKKIDVSGTVSETMKIKGTIKGISSDINYTPILLDLVLDGVSNINIAGKLFQNNKAINTNIVVNAPKYPLHSLLDDSSFEKIDGFGDIKVDLKDTGKVLQLKADLKIKHLTLELKSNTLGKELQDAVAFVLKDMKDLHASLVLTKQGDDVDISFKSSLEGILKRRLSKYMQHRLAGVKDKAQAMFQEQVGGIIGPVGKQVNIFGDDLSVDSTLKQLQGFESEGSDKKNALKDFVKKKGTSQLEDKLGDQFKKFKF